MNAPNKYIGIRNLNLLDLIKGMKALVKKNIAVMLCILGYICVEIAVTTRRSTPERAHLGN